MQIGRGVSPLLKTKTRPPTISGTFDKLRDSNSLSRIDDRLIEWGQWAKKNSEHLGFPRRTAESRAGEGTRDKHSRRVEPDHPNAQEIEAIVVNLPDNLSFIALKHYVFNRGSNRQKARDLGVHERRYYALIETLQYTVLSVLSQKKL